MERQRVREIIDRCRVTESGEKKVAEIDKLGQTKIWRGGRKGCQEEMKERRYEIDRQLLGKVEEGRTEIARKDDCMNMSRSTRKNVLQRKIVELMVLQR